MPESIRDILAQEAEEAEAVAEAGERGERAPAPGQRGRRPSQDPAQVYSVRIPVSRLEQLRSLAAERGVAPSVLLRQFALERLEEETTSPRHGQVAKVSDAERAVLVKQLEDARDHIEKVAADIRKVVAGVA